MAAGTWPHYARQRSDGYELTAGATVRRTEFDDGAIRQAPSVSRARARRTVVAEIPGARLAEFRGWIQEFGQRYFVGRDVGGPSRGMRVVGGLGGVAFRQVRKTAGAALWEAQMVLEDTEGVAGGAPFFTAASIEHVLDDRSPLTLPWPYSGRPPFRGQFLPAVPAGVALDAATRTLTCSARVAPVDEASYEWRVTDADGRVASISPRLAVARRFEGPYVKAGNGAITIRPAYNALPDAWFDGAAPDPTDRYLESFGFAPFAVGSLSIGPVTSRTDFNILTEVRLHLRFTAAKSDGKMASFEMCGPNSSLGIRSTSRDSQEPYLWQSLDEQGGDAFLESLPARGTLSLSLWRTSP